MKEVRMLGRTHQLVAVGSVVSAGLVIPPESLTSETAMVSLLMAMLGGLTPDIDKPGSKIWDHIPAGGCLSRLVNPFFLGGHRHITHSLLGMVLFGIAMKAFLGVLPLGDRLDQGILVWSFIIAFASHVFADMITKEGVPLLFPLPVQFGFPPVEFLRMRTNGLVEKLVVAPGVVLAVTALGYVYHDNAIRLLELIGMN